MHGARSNWRRNHFSSTTKEATILESASVYKDATQLRRLDFFRRHCRRGQRRFRNSGARSQRSFLRHPRPTLRSAHLPGPGEPSEPKMQDIQRQSQHIPVSHQTTEAHQHLREHVRASPVAQHDRPPSRPDEQLRSLPSIRSSMASGRHAAPAQSPKRYH